MAERRKAWVRVLFFGLLTANALVFAYWLLRPDTQRAAAARIEELQINPARIRLLGAATRGGGQGAQPKAASKAASPRACLEWGPFSGTEIAGAESALAALALAQPPVQRALPDVNGEKRVAYLVREPDTATVGHIAELQRNFAGTEIKAVPCSG
ncbi:MAG: hypothetical protein ACXW2I_17640 [Burkholderiales bacterium]